MTDSCDFYLCLHLSPPVGCRPQPAAVGENDQGANISSEVSRCGLRGGSDVSYANLNMLFVFLKWSSLLGAGEMAWMVKRLCCKCEDLSPLKVECGDVYF